MSVMTVTAYQSNFTGRIASAKSRKSPEIKPFHGCRSTFAGKAHCIKDRVLLDPVCGSGHCHIIPYWADTLGKETLVAYQASKRGGTLYCRREGTKIFMSGKAALYSIDELFI